MRAFPAVLATAASVMASGASAASYTGSVMPYVVQSADTGSCRLKGVDSNSDNFKFYASLSSKDVSVNEACARCIKVSKDGVAASVTAYVLDVCQGCKTGEVKLSSSVLTQLSIDPNSNNATVSYKFTNCPSSFLSGNVKACLMEGASNSYIPLEFYNSQKVIVNASIAGVPAEQNKDAFFWFGSPKTSNADTKQWYKSVEVTLTSKDGETKTGTFEFGGSTGCATSSFQFSAASTADGNDDSKSSSSGGGKSSAVLPAVIGAVVAVLLIVGSVLFIRRRRAMKEDGAYPDEPDNQYLSPTGKPNAHTPERPTYAAENSIHNSTDDPSDGLPDSPTVDFESAATPAASASAGRNLYATGSAQQQQPPPPPPPQPVVNRQHSPLQPKAQQEVSPQEYSFHSPPQSAGQAAPRYSYTGPQSFSYSKPVVNERPSISEHQRPSARAVPTFPAPVVHHNHNSDLERDSFDIDDMRETEEMKSRERLSPLSNDIRDVAPHSSESPYATPSVTSPQSYVRATTLRRKPVDRPSLRFTSSASQQDPDRDSYASDYRPTLEANPTINSFREPASGTSGYSRESLGILGYPYAKKSNSRTSVTEAQL